ncbi:hypothetical protein [Streptomyces anulatus]|uniref:hypothetical protein n=1 Tax=Streptomyces anulatus TaxID=1892 RepID=UPI00386E2D02
MQPTTGTVPGEADALLLTGIYRAGSQPPEISLYSVCLSPMLPLKRQWVWSPVNDKTLNGNMWDGLRDSSSVTEVKWADGGRKVVALVGDYIVLIAVPQHHAEDPRLVSAIKLEESASNAHSVEVLPHNRVAVADGGRNAGTSGVQVYALDGGAGSGRAGGPRIANGPCLQKLTGFPSTHGLLWDQTQQVLWAVGDTAWPRGRSQGLLRAYGYDASQQMLASEPVAEQKVGSGKRTLEDPEWWDGPHDIAGVPGKRQLLITTEENVFLCDISTGQVSEPVQAPQLDAFTSHSEHRTEADRPRSRFKSIGMRASGAIIYTQPSAWRDDYPDMIGIYLDPDKNTVTNLGRTTYKARWFEAVAGWETPPIEPSF